MISALTWIGVAAVAIPALLIAVWSLEILAGCLALRRRPARERAVAEPYRTAILVPAHNEGAGLLPTLRDAQAQLRAGDRILVVADNCTDDTADVARASGVDVAVRTDATRRGKGYALEFGVRELTRDPPDVVLVMDADCRFGPDAVRILADAVMRTGRPAQGLYLMHAPEGGAAKMHVHAFAYRIRNWLRPLGMHLLGLPTQLFGTGMAFPFGLIAGRDLGNSRLAEDTALGLDLASQGRAAIFCPDASITSWFPSSHKAADTQRLRWEQGNLSNVRDLVPRGLVRAVRDRNLQLAALAVDLSVPPLALLAFSAVAGLIAGVGLFLLGGPLAALVVPAAGVALLVLGALLSWLAVGRDVLPVSELTDLPVYLVRKLGFYRSWIGSKKPSEWVKTDRG
ncbi:MAG: glycosyltransferase family 2 protein [Hyphomicrobiaceae bacterium]|nr:glycosyltransferase family 2 protein [Hyphomicrobiaceae bacterium]